MRRSVHLFISAVFVGLLLSACTKNETADSSKKYRIISLAPHITEIIYALGAQDDLLAVTDFCNYPPDAQEKEKIGGLLDPNIEKMIALKPTHLFGLPSHEKLSEQLQPFGFQIQMMPNEQVSEVFASIRQIGSSIGRREKAEQLAVHLTSQLDSLRVLQKKQAPLPAVLLIGRNAGTLQNMTVAGTQTYLDELWRLMGGENIYRDLPTRYGVVNLESLLIRNPTVIIEFDMQKKHCIEKEKVGPEWQVLHGITAVKNGYLFVIGGNHTMIPGPRLTTLARDFYEIIQRVDALENSPVSQSE